MGALNIKKRLRIMFFIMLLIFILLIIKVGWIQFIKGNEYNYITKKELD